MRVVVLLVPNWYRGSEKGTAWETGSASRSFIGSCSVVTGGRSVGVSGDDRKRTLSNLDSGGQVFCHVQWLECDVITIAEEG